MALPKVMGAVLLAALTVLCAPGILDVAHAHAATVQKEQPVVPVGEELDERELIEARGEFGFVIGIVKLVKLAVAGGALGAAGGTIRGAINEGPIEPREIASAAAVGAFMAVGGKLLLR